MMEIISSTHSVARGSEATGRAPSASMSRWNRAVSVAASSRKSTPSSRALGRIESSTSVMLRTILTVWPRSSSRRASRS